MTIPEVPDDMYVCISGTFYITFLMGHFTQSCLPFGRDATISTHYSTREFFSMEGYWRNIASNCFTQKLKGSTQCTQRKGVIIIRNDDCPCGGGKKHKNCDGRGL